MYVPYFHNESIDYIRNKKTIILYSKSMVKRQIVKKLLIPSINEIVKTHILIYKKRFVQLLH